MALWNFLGAPDHVSMTKWRSTEGPVGSEERRTWLTKSDLAPSPWSLMRGAREVVHREGGGYCLARSLIHGEGRSAAAKRPSRSSHLVGPFRTHAGPSTSRTDFLGTQGDALLEAAMRPGGKKKANALDIGPSSVPRRLSQRDRYKPEGISEFSYAQTKRNDGPISRWNHS